MGSEHQRHDSATGSVRSRTLGFSGTEEQSFPFPVAGLEFRTVIHGPLAAGGELQGMSLGAYGHYLQTSWYGGVNLGRHISLLAGYRLVDADIHRRDASRGFAPRFSGPAFWLQFRR